MHYRRSLLVACALVCAPSLHAAAVPPRMEVWRVDDLRAGMKGHGRTVMKGTRIETFNVELLGVLRNTSPGRDLVLARLSGLDLERIGVLQGMSGSPVYVGGKLVGAVAYAWAHGKEPIAGITPFEQMKSFADSLERAAKKEDEGGPRKHSLGRAITIDGKTYDSVSVAAGGAAGKGDGEGLWLRPLRTPLASSGFTPHALKLLGDRTVSSGLVPVMGGSAAKGVVEDAKDVTLEPGGSLALQLITGDFDLSGIGTVTHVEGDRVWGWGHPFMSLGGCRLPMCTGYVHTVFPRQTVGFKMGSPLREVGVIHADVSTCIAGLTGKQADMLPVSMSVTLNRGEARKYNVKVARHRTLTSTLVYSALSNAVDMEGEMPEDVTATMNARIVVEGHEPIVIRDTFSGFSGGRVPAALYIHVSSIISQLVHNPFSDLRVTSVSVETSLEGGRRSAEIESVTLDAETYKPGDTVKARVTLKPFRGESKEVAATLTLPTDIADGEHSLIVCDEATSVRMDLRADPSLHYPSTSAQLIDGLRRQYAAGRTKVVLRLPLGAHGVVVGGKAMPRLPAGMMALMQATKRTGAATMNRALTSSAATGYVVQGAELAKFAVKR